MKNIISNRLMICRNIVVGVMTASTLLFSSCNEDKFLREVPLSFYAPENSYVTYDNFNSALMNLYSIVRDNVFAPESGGRPPGIMYVCSEMVVASNNHNGIPNWASVLLPTSGAVVDNTWTPWYRIIYDANVIIGRTNSPVSELTDSEKILIEAEARFFRAFCYRMLAQLYGGVPLVLVETAEPKRDYVRATREAVYQQCVDDLLFAVRELPNITEVDDARISKQVAQHLLSEIYICLKEWQNAIDAATAVISHPAMGLMTVRFGVRKDEKPDPRWPWANGGDVYWDLFRNGNQNRSSGNKESLWVLQYKFMTPGGFSTGGHGTERQLIPRIWQASVRNTISGTAARPVIPEPNTYYFGRGSGMQRPSHYFFQTIWKRSGFDQDMRNSEYNIVRDFIVNNPASDHNGKWLFKDNVPINLVSFDDTTRNFFPAIAKASDPGKHPQELYHSNQTVPGSLTNVAQNSFTNQYVFRLAETYLLRAEAYLGQGNKTMAAADINTVRGRAKAPAVDPADVDIDYLLDERARELHWEEFRLLTLTRLGKFVERVRKYNPAPGASVRDYHNLWPIPYGEIEKNTEAVLEQNPDYIN